MTMLNKISGIYKIQSIIKPERIYIGSAVNLHKRKRDHFNSLRKHKHHNKKLQNHFNKYGESDLVFSMILSCDKESLIKNEQFFMDSYSVFFNECKIAGSQLGCKRSEETKMKMKGNNKGNKYCLGYRHSEEIKKIISAANKGRIRSPETFKKISIANTGHVCSEETKQKMRGRTPWNKGLKGLQKETDEQKLARSKMVKEWWRLRKAV